MALVENERQKSREKEREREGRDTERRKKECVREIESKKAVEYKFWPGFSAGV